MRVELEKAIPDDPAAGGHAVREARAHPERAAHEVLGTAHAPRRRRAPAARLRRAPRGPLPARRLPRPLPPHASTASARQPPDPSLPCEHSERFRLDCYNRIQQELAHQLFQDWTAPGFPRFLVVQIQHANPYYDDSYAVNSENLGPYGDAIQYELLPVRREDVPRARPGLGPLHVRGIDGGLGGARRAGPLPGRVERLLGRLPRPDRLPRVRDDEPLRGPERLLGRGARSAAWRGRATATGSGHVSATPRAVEPRGARARHEEPLGRAVRHLGGGLLAGGGGRLPEADLRQAHGRDRPGGGGALARELRPRPHPEARLVEGPGPEAPGQDPHLHRRHGQLLPQQRGVPRGGLPEDDRPALRRRGGLRRPGRALLERRPHPPERVLPPPLRPDVRAEDGGEDREDGAAGGGHAPAGATEPRAEASLQDA